MKKILILTLIFIISGCSTQTPTTTETPQEKSSANLKFDLDLSSLSYKLPTHTKLCIPETRNDCLSGVCKKDKPVVFVLYDKNTNKIYRCDNNPCDGFKVLAEKSGLYTNLTPKTPNGTMYKFSSDNKYVETVSLGLDLIIYQGKCTDVK
jgi:hypothetical protein